MFDQGLDDFARSKLYCRKTDAEICIAANNPGTFLNQGRIPFTGGGGEFHSGPIDARTSAPAYWRRIADTNEWRSGEQPLALHIRRSRSQR